jgi:hypothetical protein
VRGWIGCGRWLVLFQLGAPRAQARLTVLEDDLLLPTDFEDKMGIVQKYLDVREGQWDVFAGLIACIHPDVKVLRVETFGGMRFMTIDKMTSTGLQYI